MRGFLCIWCREESALSQMISSIRYDDRVARIIHRIKFGSVSACIPSLAHLLIDAWNRFGSDGPWLVVPIPLHRQRLRERGFNQAEIFAKHLCSAEGLALRPELLVRKRATKAQAELERDKRHENVQNAFLCHLPHAVEGKSVLLVDDVCTTGATLNEAARTLRTAGAAEVRAISLARG